MQSNTTDAPGDLAERLLSVLAGGAAHINRTGLDDRALREAAARLADELRAVAVRPDDVPLRAIDNLADELLADYNARAAAAARHGGVVGVRSGLDHLDESLNGLQAGQLYLLGAMPGTGKTTLCLQIAGAVAQAGYPVLYLSLENDRLDLARKAACRLGGVSYTAALKGKISSQQWAAAVGELRRLRGHLMVVTPRETMPDLDALLASVAERAGQPPALLVLDYLQAFAKRGAVRADEADVRERIDRLTPQLRSLGERYGCAVLAISSQNRAGYSAGGMAALKESGDLEFCADVVLTLARPEKGKEAALPPGQEPLELRIDKNRQGMIGRPIPLALHVDRCMVTEQGR